MITRPVCATSIETLQLWFVHHQARIPRLHSLLTAYSDPLIKNLPLKDGGIAWSLSEGAFAAAARVLGWVAEESSDSALVQDAGEVTAIRLMETDSAMQIITTLRDVGHRLTRSQLLQEMTDRNLNPSEATIRITLGKMTGVNPPLLDNVQNVSPRGYWLTQWTLDRL